MLNGINNDNHNSLINARLNSQNGIAGVVTNPIGNVNPYSKENKFNFIDESAISTDAYRLYEHECDVKQFTKLALTGIENVDEDNERVEALFNEGVINPFLVDDFETLAEVFSNNDKFMQDIEFNTL